MSEIKKNFLNLDILKTAPTRIVQFLGTEFDLSYIPCGIAIPLIEAHNAQIKKELNQSEKKPTQKEMIDLELKMVTLFCNFYAEEFTADYIAKNATDKQLLAMYTQIVQSIIENFGISAPETDTDKTSKKKQIGVK